MSLVAFRLTWTFKNRYDDNYLENSMQVFLPQIIPIFPLPNVVLFPKTHLPLHIFEYRYREMIQDVLEGERLIGMALLKETWEDDDNSNQKIHSIGCVGKIIGCKGTQDGRYHIVLSGITRYTIKEKLYNKSYLQAQVEAIRPPGIPNTLSPKNRFDIDQFIHQHLKPKQAYKSLVALLGKASDETLIHSLSACLPFTPYERQFLLESEDINRQCLRMLEIIKMKSSDLLTIKGMQPDLPLDPNKETETE